MSYQLRTCMYQMWLVSNNFFFFKSFSSISTASPSPSDGTVNASTNWEQNRRVIAKPGYKQSNKPGMSVNIIIIIHFSIFNYCFCTNLMLDWAIYWSMNRLWYLWLVSFNKVLAQKEELEQKHLHLLQIVESEKTAKWQYTQQCEELTDEIKQLRTEVKSISQTNKKKF